MHSFLILSVFNDTIMVVNRDAFKAWLTFCKTAENIAHLFLSEVICPRSVISNIEIVTEFRGFSLCESQLGQIVSAIVSEEQNGTWGKLVIDFLRDLFVVNWRDCRKYEDKLRIVRCQWWKRDFLIHKVARFRVNVLSLP